MDKHGSVKPVAILKPASQLRNSATNSALFLVTVTAIVDEDVDVAFQILKAS